MIKYQYQIIRYIHDRVTGEFVNVGLIMFEPTSKYLQCQVITKYNRISHFFADINGSFLIATLKQFQHQVSEISKSLDEFAANHDFKDLSSVSDFILHKDDSALVTTEVKYGVDIQADAAFEDLYHRIVEQYIDDVELHTDQQAWQTIYKHYFDSAGITSKLHKHTIKTKKDTFDFDKAWKNGVWNCYEAVTFDLKRTDAIKNKVYKWSGILKELETSEESIKLYLLTTSPKTNQNLETFITSTLTDHQTDKIHVSVITEAEAAQFAERVKRDMEASHVL